MKVTRRQMLKTSAVAAYGLGALPVVTAAQGRSEIESGPFTANWDSLAANYRAPDWFRDAKFGLWAHWGPQCVPEAGDWYAREMYLQGSRAYQHHLANYGHPADTGFMELLPKWTAENFDPEELVSFYKAAGARYFVAMSNHHDNFDAYDSKFHEWNATRIGPKRDVIGLWAEAAHAHGLKFGVSNHSAHAWHWFQTAYDYDPEGPRAGQRYDAYKLRKSGGKGKWWEGLDPQTYYAGPSIVMPDGITTIDAANAWHETNDRKWDERAPQQNPAFVRQWFLRCKDLMDTYEPDLVYFDNFGLPLEQAGLDVTAHFYNRSIKRNGSLQAVVNCKEIQIEARRKAVVEDVERGLRSEIHDAPWQTDTCLGNWHYDKELFERKGYKSAASVIHMLCDVVSKNGNLLLSVPVKPDGTIDSEERRIVSEIGEWMQINGNDAIYGTRPWRQYGEGPTEVMSGIFAENRQKPFTWQDVRYSTKGGAVFAMTLGQPAGPGLVLKAFGKGHVGRVERVELVGSGATLTFEQRVDGLHLDVPEGAGHRFGAVFKISGPGLVT